MALQITNSVGSKGVNTPADVIAVKERLIELGFDWLAPTAEVDVLTIHTIRLFQAIKNSFNRVSDPRNAKVDPGGDTLKWLQARNAPRWQRMPEGSKAEGFINAELLQTADQAVHACGEATAPGRRIPVKKSLSMRPSGSKRRRTSSS